MGEIYPLWVISGEVVGVFCEGCLLPEGRQQLADFRAGRLRLPDEHVQS